MVMTKQFRKSDLKSKTFLPSLIPAALALLVCAYMPVSSQAQLISTDSYEVGVAPDVWFNSVDGVIVGLRFRGEDPRTFLDGPNRINAGVWLGTRIPDTPVSYMFNYAHPVERISSPQNEGAIHLRSSIRTGVHRHEAGLSKRWQPGFDEYETFELEGFAGLYYRFDHDYLLYEELWQESPVLYFRTNAKKRDRNLLGRWTASLTATAGLPADTDDPFINFAYESGGHPEALGTEGLFGQAQLELLQHISMPAGFSVRTRLFGGFSSDAVPPELRYSVSEAASFDQLRSPLTRAKGTIPVDWVRSGWVHVAGGPALRGYTMQTTDSREAGVMGWVQHAIAMNLDFYYPNPINTYFAKIPYLGDVLRLESYLFTDAGLIYQSYAENALTGDAGKPEWQQLLLNTGAGFMLSFNIPDYLGRDRGFFIRYEIPFWVSEVPGDEDNFDIRHVLGVGSQFRF